MRGILMVIGIIEIIGILATKGLIDIGDTGDNRIGIIVI